MAQKSRIRPWIALATLVTAQMVMDFARADAGDETAAGVDSAAELDTLAEVANAIDVYPFKGMSLIQPECDCLLSANPKVDEPPRDWKLIWMAVDGGTYYCALYECISPPTPGCFPVSQSLLFKPIETGIYGQRIVDRRLLKGLWTRTMLSKDLTKCTK